MSGRNREREWLLPVGFALALAVAALACWRGMRHFTYLRQVLLTALLAPAALAAALAVLGPTGRALRSALAGGPARVFLAAVWGHALLAWVSLAWTASPAATLDRAIVLVTLAAWASAWLLAASKGRRPRLAAGHLAVGGLIAAVGAMYHVSLLAAGSAPARLSAPISNANTVAVLMIFPIAGAVALLPGSFRKWYVRPWPVLSLLLLLGGGFALASFAFAWSRSGLAGLLVALTVLGLLWLRPFWRLIAAGALAAVLVLALATGGALLASGSVKARARRQRLEEKVKLSSIGARYYGPTACWGMFREHPLAGAGAGAFFPEAPRHLPPERYLGSYGKYFLSLAHNEWAETAAELGVLGLLALVALFGSAFWGAWRGAAGGRSDADRALCRALGAAVCGVAVSSLADPSLRFWDFTGFFYAAAALAAAAGNRRERPEEGTSEAEPPPGPLAVRRLLVLMGGVLAVAAVSVLWSYPDARREVYYQKGHHWAYKRRPPDDATAAGYYKVAARTPGYFRSRFLAHYEWVESRVLLGRRRKPAEAEPESLLAWRRETVAEAERLTEVVRECPQVLRLLAKARAWDGDRAGALAALVGAGRRDPYSRTFPKDFTDVFTKDAAKNAALAQSAGQRLSLERGEAAALASLAAAAAGDWDAALDAMKGLSPGEVEFLPLEFWRGMVLLRAKQPQRAIAALKRHVKLVRLHAQGYRELARAHASAGGEADPELEITALRRCLELNVEHEEGRFRLAWALMARERYKEALDVVLPYLGIARRKARFFLLAAEIYQRRGQHYEARRLLEKGLLKTRSAKIRKALEAMDSADQ